VSPPRAAIVIAAFIGLSLSAYLTWVHYSGSLALCAGAGGCETVQASRYAMVGPVPVAVVGLVGFAAILVAAVAYARRIEAALVPLFSLSLGAVLYVSYLTYLEVFVIHAICPWCVAVALCAVAALSLSSREIFSSEAA